MEYIIETIAQEYLAHKRTLQAMEAELQLFPAETLSHRNVRGHRYCYIEFRDASGTRHSKLVPKAETEKVEQIFQRRAFLRKNIKALQSHIRVLEKAYPQFRTLVDATLQRKFSENSGKPYLTAKGDYVRSKSEVIIANELYNHGISYDYEKPLLLSGYSKPILPDFTIYTPMGNSTIFWEHCGLMNDSEYRSKWEWKKQLYERNGISDWQKNLIVTYEAQNGDFSVEDIRQHVARLLRS